MLRSAVLFACWVNFVHVPKKEILYSTVLSLYCTLQKWCCELGLSCAIYSALEIAVGIGALFSYSWQVDTEAEAMGAATECIEKTAQAHWELTVFAAVSVLHNAALFVPDVNFAICSKRNTGMHCIAQ